MTTQRISNLALYVAIAFLCLTGCRSGKIAVEGGKTTLSTSKREVLAGIEDRARAAKPFQTYYAKNASTSVEMGTASYSLKSNIFMDLGKETIIAARVPFPPLVVGSVRIAGSKVGVRSGMLGVNQNIQIPAGISDMLQNALLGIVPDVYRVFGENDFGNYDITITADDCYRLTRTRGSVTVEILLNADFSLRRAALHGAQEMRVDVVEWSEFDGHKLPSRLSVSLNMGGKSAQTVEADVSVSKVALDGKDRLTFE